MRFQFKLLIALVGSIAAVTLFALWETGKTVRATHRALFETRFDAQMSALVDARQERLQRLTELCERAAEAGLVVDALRRPNDRVVLERLREDFANLMRGNGDKSRAGDSPRGGTRIKLQPAARRSGGPNMPVAAVFGTDGQIRPLSGIRKRTKPQKHDDLLQLLNSPEFDGPQVGYMMLEGEDGHVLIRESIATPVTDPDNDQLLGGLLLGNSAPRLAGVIGEGTAGADEAILSGVFTNDTLESNSIGPDLALEAAAEIRHRLGAGAESQFPLRHGGKLSHQVFFEVLNEGSAFPPAYQVALYPLGGQMAELAQLRTKLIGIALLALLAALPISWIIARNLSVPVRALSEGTEAIRRGDLEARVPVRSRDELGKLASSFNEMAEGLALKEQYREVLGKVADQSVAQALVSGELELGGERRTLSVLFCDIRSFTELSANRAPDEMIELLNDHMTAMTEVVYQHGGVVDKYVGDLVMAIFGAPKSYGNDAENGLRCALAMVERRHTLNAEAEVPIQIGIGVATGEMVVGMMGSEHRQDYTVIGERVNLGSRLTDAAAAGEVIVDNASVESLGESRLGLEERELMLKGYTDTVRAYLLKGIAAPAVPAPHG